MTKAKLVKSHSVYVYMTVIFTSHCYVVAKSCKSAIVSPPWPALCVTDCAIVLATGHMCAIIFASGFTITVRYICPQDIKKCAFKSKLVYSQYIHGACFTMIDALFPTVIP